MVDAHKKYSYTIRFIFLTTTIQYKVKFELENSDKKKFTRTTSLQQISYFFCVFCF